MKQVLYLLGMAVFCMFSAAAFGQDIDERLNNLENALKSQARTIEEQQKTIDALKEEIARQKNQGPMQQSRESEQAGQETQSAGKDLHQKVQELTEKVEQVAEAQTRTFPGIFNPAIGVVGETVFGYRSRKSSETGSGRPGGYDINQRSVELNIAASVDPFAKAYVVINASAEWPSGEAKLGVEEAALQTTSLPWNLELKAGRFFGEFGRLAYIHDHELPVVNRPLALDQYIGGESRTDGAQLNWLLPVDHYISLTAGLGTQFGGDNPPNHVGEFRNFSGLNFWSRLSTYFDLTPDISLEPGISGLWNPHTAAQWDPGVQALPVSNRNTFTERERRLLGTDLVLSYKPLRNNQYQSLTWGTELLYSDNRYDVSNAGKALPGGSVGTLGLYSYLAYKFHRQWTTGLMFDWVEDAVNKKAQTFAYSPYITWVTSHWNQIRLQYTYTDHNAESTAAFGLRTDHAVYLQWAWIIGAHSHGWQQR
jgi:hypothetical protein